MAEQTIYTGQSLTKDSVVGDRLMNRYAIFNGLEKPRRIDQDLAVTILGIPEPGVHTVAENGAGNLTANWYAWVAVYGSTKYTRPVAVLDSTGNSTRGNPNDAVSLNVAASKQVDITVPATAQEGITHIFVYRSLGASSQSEAEAGPFFFVALGVNTGTSVVITDNVNDDSVGVVAETDNFEPPTHRYAVVADSHIFAGGNFPLGTGLSCTVTSGSGIVTLDGTQDLFFDGIVGWRFKVNSDTAGGVNQGGLYFANFVDSKTLQLVDALGDNTTYDGTASGDSNTFTLYIPGYVLRWSKNGEPEAWPAFNLLNFEGDITGIARLPNQPILIVCTDEPSMYALDLTLLGTNSFKLQKILLTTEHTVSSHYSLVGVEGRLRGIDQSKGAIIETDGTVVRDISSQFIPEIFPYLSNDQNSVKLWHCAYDKRQNLFGAFVTFLGNARRIDFCLGQHTLTGSWFFNWEKDLLTTGQYIHPATNEAMVLGGTEGIDGTVGGVWGRIWVPDIYEEWIPPDSLKSGTITSVESSTAFTVDNTVANFGDLRGLWVLVSDAKGEYQQLGYISSNTVNQITVHRVVNSLSTVEFDPVPVAGWKYYVGMIECRWGPRRYDFGDPDILKKIWEIWCTVSNHDEANPPFFRLYRGFEAGYDSQSTIQEVQYLDRTKTQSLVNKVDHKLEPVQRWGVAWYDRSYNPTILRSVTIVFNPLQDVKGVRSV